ncbi:MAG: NADH-quinone oxidoreductase subunit L [Deltaproteobacteria bacterium]|nr:NADH-quinone oxidoreductase subunit L [Deltaproteobacteria bacterium]
MFSRLLLIPLLPLLGAAYLMLAGQRHTRSVVQTIAILAVFASCVISLDAFFVGLPAVVHEGGISELVYTWFAAGSVEVDLALRMDSLSGLMCLVVTSIGTLIHFYSIGYMAHDEDYARFFAYMNLFCGAMLLLVLGDTLPVLFIGWEGVGLSSYLLIGFWYKEHANASAGRKAFITNRIGDFGFLIGMFLLFRATGSLDIPVILGAAQDGSALSAPLWLGQSVAFWAGVFLFLGAAGKSAQIPLYVWLPDAMAGPTPVSALIHAATMVTAGVYLVARMSAVYLLAPAALAIVALVGALTALFAALIGFAQNDFKRVLAYSTVSQLGFMFAGVGTANFAGGIFHLFTHAFFKAGLFLCAGSVMHAMSGLGDITKMGGLGKRLPWTTRVFQICWLSICGVPIFSGFFSKDALLGGAFGTEAYGHGLAWVGPLVGVILLVAALGTAFYMSRLYFLVFSGPCRADEQTQHHIHESPVSMVFPLVVLAAGALFAGFAGVPPALRELFGKHGESTLAVWLEPAVGAPLAVAHRTEWIVMGISTALALVGIGFGYFFYGGGYRAPAHAFARKLPRLVALVRDKFRVDEIYDAILVRPLQALCRITFLVVDRVLVDKILVGIWAFVADVGGRACRFIQAGDVQRYLAVFAIGLAALVWVAARPAAPKEIQVVVTGRHAKVTLVDDEARSGNLQYRFDFDGDGVPDREGKTASASWIYGGPARYTVAITIEDARWHTRRVVERDVEVRP